MKVTTADFIKNYGALMDKALSEPVTISRNGRDWLVMLSAEEYVRLKRRDRRVVRLEEFSDEEETLTPHPTPLPPELGFTRVRHFKLAEVGYIRLRLGEGADRASRLASSRLSCCSRHLP
jgi:hypothetical protein